jgi:hypothetical protein
VRKKTATWVSMVVGGVVTFYVTGLSLGKPKSSEEASRNFWIVIAAAIVVFLIPRILVGILDRFGYTNAWKVWLVVYVVIVEGVVVGFLVM